MVFEKENKEEKAPLEEKPKEFPKEIEEKPAEKPAEIPEAKEEPKLEKLEEFDAKGKYEEMEKTVAELAGKVSMITEALDKLVEVEEEASKEMNEVKSETPIMEAKPEPAKYSKEMAELNAKVESMEKQLAQFSICVKKTLSSNQNIVIEESDAVRNLRRFMER